MDTAVVFCTVDSSIYWTWLPKTASLHFLMNLRLTDFHISNYICSKFIWKPFALLPLIRSAPRAEPKRTTTADRRSFYRDSPQYLLTSLLFKPVCWHDGYEVIQSSVCVLLGTFCDTDYFLFLFRFLSCFHSGRAVTLPLYDGKKRNSSGAMTVLRQR